MNMFKKHIKRAQVTIEYAMVAACIVAAFLMMMHYVKRAAQGRLREAADSIGEQYDAHHVNSIVTFTQIGNTDITALFQRVNAVNAESGQIDGIRTITTTHNEIITRSGNENLQAFTANLYD